MAKKAKSAGRSRPKPEATASRVPPANDTAPRKFVFDKLGKVLTWNLPTKAYAGETNLRGCFIGGFEARVHQVQQIDVELTVPQRFNAGSKEQRAFEDGYHEAANQDGQNREAKKLAGK